VEPTEARSRACKLAGWLSALALALAAPTAAAPTVVTRTSVTTAALPAPAVVQVSRKRINPAARRPSRHVLVSIPDRKLAVLENGKVIGTFRIAVGASASPSPTGEFRITSRLSDPTYYHSGVVIPPGSDNPVGPRWVGLSQKGYGIHGTNEPWSIGRAASHGCIRMRNRDIEQFFSLVSVGDTVGIRGKRDEQTAQLFGGVTDRNAVVVAQAQAAPLAEAGGGQ
jgi:lipoprotein-anchoring transpeptidase ErfK/SrfK